MMKRILAAGILALAAPLFASAQLDTVDPNIWQDQGGDLTHIQSGGTCPNAMGSFERKTVRAFAANGSNVGCSYSSNAFFTTITYYVYTDPRGLEEEFEDVLDAVMSNMAAYERSEFRMRPAMLPGGGADVRAKALAFTSDDGVALRTAALLTEVDGWKFKIRVTYPALYAAEIESITESLLLDQHARILAE